MSTKITLFPAGTTFFEPDAIHQVTVMFPTENDAIVFYEWCLKLCATQEAEKRGSSGRS